MVAVKPWQSVSWQETQHLLISMCARLPTVIDYKGFSSVSIKKKVVFIIVCPVAFKPLKTGGLCVKMAVNA